MSNEIKKHKINITGLHILGEIYTKDTNTLKNMAKMRSAISKIIEGHNLKKIGEIYYKFPQGGFTGIVSLVESHVAVHTWPEFHYLTLDVYLCNYKKNNSSTCKKVFNEIVKIFKPLKIKKTEIKR